MTVNIQNKSGRYALLEQLLADDIHYIFGNPGVVEQGILDALSDMPQIKYILSLQESVAVAMADGYARATKKPGIVQLHSNVGLGNSIGMLYQAWRGHSPLVIISSDAGVQYDALDARLGANQVAMAKPVTKWATRVVDPSSLLRVLRRALKIAATPPMGPVYICLPMDVLDAPIEEDIVPTSFPITRVTPEPEYIDQIATMLATAQRPMFLIGDGVAASDAQTELARVAELSGADVWGVDSSEVNMSARNPLFQGQLGHLFGEHSREITTQADVVLICGTRVFPEVFPALSDVFAEDAKIIQIDLNGYEVAKNFSVDLGLISDPRATLAQVASALSTIMTPDQQSRAAERVKRYAAHKELEGAKQRVADKGRRTAVPLQASRFMEDLAEQLPPDAIIFDEALTSSPDLVRYLPPTEPGQYFLTRGGSLGVGIPGALGIKLANPERKVISFSGDGASMYTIQALWTAAHHRIGAKFVICNNRSYELLKLNLRQYWQMDLLQERAFPPAFDLADPDLRFDRLAQAMGVQAVRVEKPQQIGPAIKQMLANNEPFLLDLVVTSEVPEHIRFQALYRYGQS